MHLYKFVVSVESDELDSEEVAEYIRQVLDDTVDAVLDEEDRIDVQPDFTNEDYENDVAINAAADNIKTSLDILDERFSQSPLINLVQKTLRTLACGIADIKACMRCIRLFTEESESCSHHPPQGEGTHYLTPQTIHRAPQHILIELSAAIAADLGVTPPAGDKNKLIEWIEEKIRGMRRRPEMLN